MTDEELRALVRQTIARRSMPGGPGKTSHSLSHAPLKAGEWSSHALFEIWSGADADGPCLIEPSVTCNHCGYCKSMGH